MTTTRTLKGWSDLTKLERELLRHKRQIIEMGSMGSQSWNGQRSRKTDRRWVKVDDDGILRVKIKARMVIVRPTRVTLPTGASYLTFKVEETDAETTKVQVQG